MYHLGSAWSAASGPLRVPVDVVRSNGRITDTALYLLPSELGQLHPVIWCILVNLAVLVALRLSVSNDDDHLNSIRLGRGIGTRC